jgi:hypothetical protein
MGDILHFADQIQIGHEQLAAQSARADETGADGDAVGIAAFGEFLQQFLARALPDGHEDDDGSHADHDAEQGEQGAEAVGGEGAPAAGNGFEDVGEPGGVFFTASRHPRHEIPGIETFPVIARRGAYFVIARCGEYFVIARRGEYFVIARAAGPWQSSSYHTARSAAESDP